MFGRSPQPTGDDILIAEMPPTGGISKTVVVSSLETIPDLIAVTTAMVPSEIDTVSQLTASGAIARAMLASPRPWSDAL